jgi:hypothetical protein
MVSAVDFRHIMKKSLGLKDPQSNKLHLDTGDADVAVRFKAEVTVSQWLKDVFPSFHDIGLYFFRLFPFLKWIRYYNIHWFLGDLIAGVIDH